MSPRRVATSPPGEAPASAAAWVPAEHSLDALSRAAAGCRGCDLWEHATQTVFGAGNPRAELFLVGEQPGDVEDRRGAPFVGPAGGVLRRALAEAGIGEERVYLTNAVKHFRFERRGNGRRLHKSPGTTEIVACRPWLDAELDAVDPPVVVVLGSVAARSLCGAGTKVSERRPPFRWRGRMAVVSIHPSAALRAPAERRAELMGRLVDDLRAAAEAAASSGGREGRDGRHVAGGRGPAERLPSDPAAPGTSVSDTESPQALEPNEPV